MMVNSANRCTRSPEMISAVSVVMRVAVSGSRGFAHDSRRVVPPEWRIADRECDPALGEDLGWLVSAGGESQPVFGRNYERSRGLVQPGAPPRERAVAQQPQLL